MAVKRGRNIGGLLANKLTGGGTDRGTHGYKIGNQVYYDTEGEEGNNFLKAIDRYYTKDAERRLKKGQKASMADFGDEEGGGAWNEILGLLDSDSIGTEKKEYLDVDTEGDNRYLNKLAVEEFAEKEFLKSDDDLGFAENQKDILSPELSTDQYRDRVQKEPGAAWRSELDENALDALARTEPERLKAERAKEISLADFKGEEEGSWWDEVKGLFSSDSIGRDETLEQETKDNEALAGKIGAAAKLYSLLQPEQAQAAPTIPTARITRGSVAFPGMKLASQKERRKYFTPKGLMA